MQQDPPAWHSETRKRKRRITGWRVVVSFIDIKPVPEERSECKCIQAGAAFAGFEEREGWPGMDARGKKRVSQMQHSKAKRFGNQTQAAPGHSGVVALSGLNIFFLPIHHPVWCPKCSVLVVACCTIHRFEVFGNIFLEKLQCPQSVVENISDPLWHWKGKLRCF